MAYQRKLDQVIRCPFEYGLQLFGGKWNARILCLLSSQKPLRFQRIREELGTITDAMLSHALHGLQTEGLVTREAYNEVPPRVEYRLTEKGQSVLPLLQGICRWSQQQHQLDDSKLLSPCKQCVHRNVQT